eukprot:Em0078g6a
MWRDWFVLKVNLNPNTGMFITTNPAGKGYGGHQKLPTISNTDQSPSPDHEQIAVVILFAEGFSSLQHYDWDLKALKTETEGMWVTFGPGRSSKWSGH